MLREKLGWLDAVVFTHAHADHIMGLDDCRRVCDLRGGKALPIYANEETMRDLARVCLRVSRRAMAPRLFHSGTARYYEGPFQIGDLHITPFRSAARQNDDHRFSVRARRRKRLAYLSDCKEVPDARHGAVRGVEVVVLDALRYAPHPTHMCLDEALTAARRIGADRTYFTHLTHDYDHDIAQAELPLGVELAYDGLRVEIP